MNDQQIMRRFQVLGVGPGDPELLTVKAVNCLQHAQIIYHAGPSNDQGRALDILRTQLRPEQSTRTVRFDSMNAVNAEGPTAYRRGVEQIAADCRSGAGRGVCHGRRSDYLQHGFDHLATTGRDCPRDSD